MKTGILVAVGVIAAAIGLSALGHRISDQRFQDDLDAFYATPPGIEGAEPGTVLRLESLTNAVVSGAASYRVLYRTERPNGTPAVSSAMVFVPVAPAAADGRPVLAYAHGTLGQGRGCAPSRRRDPIGPGSVWIAQAVAAGFVVTMPDYAGLGTAGPNLYLVGQAEARDVVNAVRAVEEVPGAKPGRRWAVWGHSQGGHSALWSAELAEELLPEHELVGAAAAAPSADLPLIMDEQWASGVGWAVGAEVTNSWPFAYPTIDIDAVLSSAGGRWSDAVADACLGEGLPIPPLLGLVAAGLGVPYYDGNPLRHQPLADAAAAETPPPLRGDLPLLIAQGTADSVVPPSTNALLAESWCAAGTDLTMLWLGGVGHIESLAVSAPTIVPWLRARFDDDAVPNNCGGAPPVAVPMPVLWDVVTVVD